MKREYRIIEQAEGVTGYFHGETSPTYSTFGAVSSKLRFLRETRPDSRFWIQCRAISGWNTI